MKKSFMKILWLAIIIIMSLSLFACAKGVDSPSSNESKPELDTEAPIIVGSGSRKLIYNVRIELFVANVDAVSAVITDNTSKIGGWIDSSNQNSYGESSYKSYSYTLRIPTEKLDEFVGLITAQGKLNSKNVQTTDITASYVDATSKKASLLAEKAKLEALTPNNVQETMTIYQRVANIDADVNALTTMIENYDSLAKYSEVNIRLTSGEKEVDLTWIPILILSVLLVASAITAIIFYGKNKKLRKRESI